MANTLHTGIPKLQWVGAYPPCTPSVVISADLNPFCSGDDVMFTPVFDCVDTAVNTEVKYGLLYNWWAATDARKISSSDDWVVPSPAQWNVIPALFSNDYILTNHALKESGTTHWINDYGTNTTGFNARGSGYRDTAPTTTPTTSTFDVLNVTTLFWSTSSPAYNTQSLLRLSNSGTSIDAQCLNWLENRSNGHSIRLLYVGAGTPTSYTGNDGKIYPVVLIGSQYWIDCNLAETKYRNGDLIPEVTDNAAWAALTTGALCAYNNDWNNAYTDTSEVQSYAWMINGVIKSTSPDPFVTSELNDGDRVNLLFITPNGNTYFSNTIVVQEKTEGCEPEAEPALELTFDDISNVPVSDANNVSDWNTFFNLPINGSPFTSVEVVGGLVRLIGGIEIRASYSLFGDNTHLIYVSDEIGIIVDAEAYAFGGCVNMTGIKLNGLVEAGDDTFSGCISCVTFNLPNLAITGISCFYGNTCEEFNFPELLTIGSGTFYECMVTKRFILPKALNYTSSDIFYMCNAMQELYIPSTEVIGTGNNDGMFYEITGQNITVTCHPALMTCNGGYPDGDIQYLIDNNTVTIITV